MDKLNVVNPATQYHFNKKKTNQTADRNVWTAPNTVRQLSYIWVNCNEDSRKGKL